MYKSVNIVQVPFFTILLIYLVLNLRQVKNGASQGDFLNNPGRPDEMMRVGENTTDGEKKIKYE